MDHAHGSLSVSRPGPRRGSNTVIGRGSWFDARQKTVQLYEEEDLVHVVVVKDLQLLKEYNSENLL